MATGGPIAPGKYPARLIGGELEKARSGNTCFCLRWEISEGEYAERRLLSRHWLTPKAVSRTKAELSAIGIDARHLRGAAALPEARAVLSVVTRSDEASDLFNEVKRVRPLDSTEKEATAETREPVAVETPSPGPVAPSDDDFLDSEFGG
jgi:hypothetical protein